MIEGCYDCAYYIPGARTATADGTCHRFAPGEWSDADETTELEPPDEYGNSLVTMVSTRTYTGWPDVASSDWCGEYRPRVRACVLSALLRRVRAAVETFRNPSNR